MTPGRAMFMGSVDRVWVCLPQAAVTVARKEENLMQPNKDLVLGARYRLTERLAMGGMGEVWMAHDTVLRRAVAVKILKPELLGSTEFVERFRAEARHAAALTNPGIASVFDYGEDQFGAFLVMEFVPGEALSDVLTRTPVPSLATTLSVLAQTAQALAAAHAGGVIHRDVKPGNLMILPDGSVKVTDFGIARAIDAAPLTMSGQVVGTPQYMSPEQASGQPITPSTDLYSLGVIGYEMLSGRRPFTGDSAIAVAMAQVNDAPPPLPAGVPLDVRRLIERVLSKRPADRPASAEAFAAELRRAQISTAPPPGMFGEAYAPTRLEMDPATAAMPIGAQRPVAHPGAVVVKGAAVAARRRRLPWLVGAIAAIAVVAALLAANRQDRPFDADAASATSDAAVPVTAVASADSTATTVASAAAVETAAPAATVPSPTTLPPVNIDPQLYIGKRTDEVVAALEALGLVPEVRFEGNSGPTEKVIAIEPSGPVAPQSTVIVSVGSEKGKPGKG